VTHHVLEHHDGVVHHESHAKNQRHHREVIEAEIQQIHDRERSHNRERQRHGGDQCGRGVPQKQKNDHDHQAERERHGGLDVLEGLANILRAVAADRQVH